jgi:hypothetical protein
MSGLCVRRITAAVGAVVLLAAGLPAVLAIVTAPVAAADVPPAGAASTWYFAEGNTLPGWYEFLVMINPDPNNDITVNVQYQLEQPAGVPAGTRAGSLVVPAGQRKTINVSDAQNGPDTNTTTVGRTFTGVAAKLTAVGAGGAPASFVAERPMYFVNSFDVGEVNGAHDALGVNAPSTDWYFAEGSTLQNPAPGVVTPVQGAPDQLQGFMPFFTMQNTSGTDATATITYYTNNPDSVVNKTIRVPNNARITTDIANAYDNSSYPGSLGPGFEGFGTRIVASQPIIVERPFYINRDFGDLGLINGASDERGATVATGTQSLFAEGTVLPDFQEFLTLFNPNATATAAINVVYQVENASAPVTKAISVPALSRRTIQIFSDTDPAGIGRAIPQASAPGSAGVSVKLASTNGVGFVAERPMYFIHGFDNGTVNGSHDVLGADSADTSWFFAEGTIRPGFFEFVTIQNPNDVGGTARLDYFVDSAHDGDRVPAVVRRQRRYASEPRLRSPRDVGARCRSDADQRGRAHRCRTPDLREHPDRGVSGRHQRRPQHARLPLQSARSAGPARRATSRAARLPRSRTGFPPRRPGRLGRD